MTGKLHGLARVYFDIDIRKWIATDEGDVVATPVWKIRQAMIAAYEKGKEDGRRGK